MNEVVIGAGATITVQVAGRVGIPASGVDSVAINIAASGRTSSGGVTAYPSNESLPNTIAVWFRNWFYAHNLLFVKVGTDGKIKLTNTDPSSTVKVFVDAHGYTVSTPAAVAGSTFVPVKPARIGQVTVPANGSALAEPLGKAGIPSAGVSDVMFTMSGKSDTHGTIVTYPSDAAQPGDTTLDYGQNLLVQNQVISRPGADGKVKFTNMGTKAITLTLDAVGYFAEPTAAVTGSLLLPIKPHNLVTDVSVPAGGTYTVAPLGQGGVPTSGVGGVYLVVTNYYYSTGTGVLRVHPSGEAPTEAHGVAVQQAHAYGGAMPARVGADGKIVIHNDSTTATRIWVEQYAYFETPATGCTGAAPAADPAPAKVAAAVPEPYNPTTVLQASPVSGGSLGTLELAYTDGIGRLMHGRADPSALGSMQWTPIHGQEGYYGQPALGEQADGRLNVLAHNLDGDVWSRTQATKDPATWGDWVDVESPMGSTVTVARHDETLVAFAVDAAGTLRALPQYAADDPYKNWIDLGVTGLSTDTAPLAVPVANGLQLFFLDTSGTWRTALYARGTVSDCGTLSGPGHSGNASVVTYPGNRLRIFVRNPNGHIVTKAQDGSGNFQATWDQVGNLVAAGSPSAVLSPGSGKTEVVARGTDDRVHSTGETIQGSGQWRAWVDAQPDYDTSVPATDPTAFTYSATNGPTWSYLFRTVNQQTRVYWPEEETARIASKSPEFGSRALPKPPAAR
ncbi:hypothetical protein [Actinomadura sp. 7K534]|uniref:hypothetical protein n=1 Tax=Actinomadura sp. 7K534 TaxID=2530366 RepID=UPI00104F5301|nr:hypothetical protein [Actinomadura sp. 7K534]TDB90076.1 hypothetical protein E1266_28710 [Actinomadura sp. 7K534]